jgi:hypothetical protein
MTFHEKNISYPDHALAAASLDTNCKDSVYFNRRQALCLYLPMVVKTHTPWVAEKQYDCAT